LKKGVKKMPLTMASIGETNTIRKVGGNEETKRFLENLGFVAGAEITVVSAIGGNVIVNIKDSRVAINQDMARHIMV
jgi:ferrous iron transport protein A